MPQHILSRVCRLRRLVELWRLGEVTTPNCLMRSSSLQISEMLSMCIVSRISETGVLLLLFTVPRSKHGDCALTWPTVSPSDTLRNEQFFCMWLYKSLDRNMPRQWVHSKYFVGLTVLFYFLAQIKLPFPVSSTLALWLKLPWLRIHENSTFLSAGSCILKAVATYGSSLWTVTKCLCIFIFGNFSQKNNTTIPCHVFYLHHCVSHIPRQWNPMVEPHQPSSMQLLASALCSLSWTVSCGCYQHPPLPVLFATYRRLWNLSLWCATHKQHQYAVLQPLWNQSPLSTT